MLQHLEEYSFGEEDNNAPEMDEGYAESTFGRVYIQAYDTEDYGRYELRKTGIWHLNSPSSFDRYCDVTCGLSSKITVSIGKKIARRIREMTPEEFIKEYEEVE